MSKCLGREYIYFWQRGEKRFFFWSKGGWGIGKSLNITPLSILGRCPYINIFLGQPSTSSWIFPQQWPCFRSEPSLAGSHTGPITKPKGFVFHLLAPDLWLFAQAQDLRALPLPSPSSPLSGLNFTVKRSPFPSPHTPEGRASEMAFMAVLESDLRALSAEARRRYPAVKDGAEHAILKVTLQCRICVTRWTFSFWIASVFSDSASFLCFLDLIFQVGRLCGSVCGYFWRWIWRKVNVTVWISVSTSWLVDRRNCSNVVRLSWNVGV